MCVVHRREGGPACPQPDCHISQHYKLLLQLFLQCHKAPGIMFLEEDLEVAPDFFSYFEATAPLMAKDSSIYCVSAWADHGQRGRAQDSRALYRTDVMPGLGWYLNAAIGLELAPKWPMTNWDDWMRLPGIKNGRSCIYPEVCGCGLGCFCAGGVAGSDTKLLPSGWCLRQGGVCTAPNIGIAQRVSWQLLKRLQWKVPSSDLMHC